MSIGWSLRQISCQLLPGGQAPSLQPQLLLLRAERVLRAVVAWRKKVFKGVHWWSRGKNPGSKEWHPLIELILRRRYVKSARENYIISNTSKLAFDCRNWNCFLRCAIYIIYRARQRRWSPGLVRFVASLAYRFCGALPAAFTQPGDHLLAEPHISL